MDRTKKEEEIKYGYTVQPSIFITIVANYKSRKLFSMKSKRN